MSSGNPKPPHHRFLSAFSQGKGYFLSSLADKVVIDEYDLVMGIKRSRDFLLDAQSNSGSWKLRHKTDQLPAIEYLLLLVFLERHQSEKAQKTVQFLLKEQTSEGGWGRFPGGPLELNRSVLAYLALKLSGHSIDSDEMRRAREVILASGGLEAVSPKTRIWLALFGMISYENCPSFPPELLFLPKWFPFSCHSLPERAKAKFSAFSLLWQCKPVLKKAENFSLDELIVQKSNFPQSISRGDSTSASHRASIWKRLQSALMWLDRWNLRPFKKRFQQKTLEQIRDRFRSPFSHGISFSTLVWNLIALKGSGESEDSALFQNIWLQLEEHVGERDGELLFEPGDYSVRDSSLAMLALREAQVSPDHQGLQKAVSFLLSQENRFEARFNSSPNSVEPSGWSHGLKQEKSQPDNETSCLVLMALCRALPENNLGQWTADLLLDDWSPHEADKEVSAIVSTNAVSAIHATLQIERLTPILNGLRRGCRWLLTQQDQEGGWNRHHDEPITQFNPLDSIQDRPLPAHRDQVDLGARILEMFATLNVSRDHRALKQTIHHVWARQERDFTWPGYIGINYLQGTSQCLTGLLSLNCPKHDARLIKAIEWLKQVQQDNGGWGETPASYETPSLKACGNTTPTQTAQVLLGLMAAGEVNSQEVAKGISYLLTTQNETGTWNEQENTAVFGDEALFGNHQMESISYPLIALARYRQLRDKTD